MVIGENSINAIDVRTGDTIVGILEVIATKGTAVQTMFARKIQTEFFQRCATPRTDIILELVDFCAGARLTDPQTAKLAIQVASLCTGIPGEPEVDEQIVNGGVNLICDMLNDLEENVEEPILTDALDAAKELLGINEACEAILAKLDVVELFKQVLAFGFAGASDAALELLSAYLEIVATMGAQVDSANLFKILYP